MGIERFQDWGKRDLVPAEAPVVTDDAALADLLVSGALEGADDSVPVVLTGGDLCRSLGGRGEARPGGEASIVEISSLTKTSFWLDELTYSVGLSESGISPHRAEYTSAACCFFVLGSH